MHTFLINTISNLDLSGLFEMLYFKEVEDKNLTIFKSDLESIHDITDLISESIYKDSTINEFDLIITIRINEKDIPENISYDAYKKLMTFYTYHNFIRNLFSLGFSPRNVSFFFIDDFQSRESSYKSSFELNKIIQDSINLFPWNLNEDIRNNIVIKSSYSDRKNEYLQDWLNNLYKVPGLNLYLNDTEEFIDDFINNLEKYYTDIVSDNDRYESDDPERELDEHTLADRLINLKYKFYIHYINFFEEMARRSKISTLSFNVYKKNKQELRKILFLVALNILNNINAAKIELLKLNYSKVEEILTDFQKILKGNEERLKGSLNYGSFHTFNFDSLIKSEDNYSTHDLDKNLKDIQDLIEEKNWRNLSDFKAAVENFKVKLGTLIKKGEDIFRDEVITLSKKFDEESERLNIELKDLRNYQNSDLELVTKKNLDIEQEKINNRINDIEDELLKQNLSNSEISSSDKFLSEIDTQTNYYINVLNSYKKGTFWFLLAIILASFIYSSILGGFFIFFDLIILLGVFILFICIPTYFIIRHQIKKQERNLIDYIVQTDNKAQINQENLINTYKELNKRFTYYIPNLMILNAYKNYLENIINNYHKTIEQKENHLIETKEILNNLTTILRAFNISTSNEASYDKLIKIDKSVLENSDVYTLLDKKELNKLGD